MSSPYDYLPIDPLNHQLCGSTEHGEQGESWTGREWEITHVIRFVRNRTGAVIPLGSRFLLDSAGKNVVHVLDKNNAEEWRCEFPTSWGFVDGYKGIAIFDMNCFFATTFSRYKCRHIEDSL